MIQCKGCGYSAITKQLQCPRCGKIVQKECPWCKTIIKAESKFCDECGKPIQEKEKE